MGLVKKDKKKLKTRGSVGGASSGGGKQDSGRRPYHLEKTPPCSGGCPQGTNIRAALMIVGSAEKYGTSQEEAYNSAWRLWTDINPIPAICGRVCPHPCEDACNRSGKDGGVAINSFEQFIGDWGLDKNLPYSKLTEEKRKEKVAVIGAGPAGLGCAYHLARLGYGVTIYEAMDKPGGMLRYGIPAYRMPRHILDAEIQRILDLGIELKTGVSIGKNKPYEDIQKEYDAIFVGMGAHKGKKLRCPGEDAENVYDGAEFLNLINSGHTAEVGDNVVVIGGGDTAIDAARVSLRLGAKKVTLLYRRTRNEMPAIEEEIVAAEEEGIVFHFLAAPIEIIKDGDRAVSMSCQQMELGEPDSSGRRRPVPIEGDTFTIEVSSVIAAISQEPDFEGLDAIHGGRDWVKVNKFGEEEKNENTYAGGDVTDLGLVTIALQQGRLAAETMHRRFIGEEPATGPEPVVIDKDKIVFDHYDDAARHERHHKPVAERFGDKSWDEIVEPLNEEELLEEARRCMSCGYCFDCGACWSYCQDNAIIKPIVPEHGQLYTFKHEFCTGCDKCAEVCPCGFIEMR